MAGSFNHIVDSNEGFTMEYIENLGDAEEALRECFDLITILGGNHDRISLACRTIGIVDPYPKPSDTDTH